MLSLLPNFSRFPLGEVGCFLSYGWNADKKLSKTITLIEGDKFHVPTGLKHQMFALKDTELFEFSTQHFDSDSNRIERGD